MHFKNKRGSGFGVLCPMVSIAKPQKAFLYEVWAPGYVHFNGCLCPFYCFIKFPNKSLQFWLQGQGGCSVPGHPALQGGTSEGTVEKVARTWCFLWAMGRRQQPAIWFHWWQLCNLRLRTWNESAHAPSLACPCSILFSFFSDDRPLPRSKTPHFQNEAKRTTFLVKTSLHENEKSFPYHRLST